MFENWTLSLDRSAIRISVAVLLFGLALAANAPKAQRAGEPRPEEAAPIPALREDVFNTLLQAQTCLEQNNPSCARELIDDAFREELRDHEEAQLWYLKALVESQTGNSPEAITAYQSVLGISGLPQGLYQQALLGLAQHHLDSEQYGQVLETLEQWSTLTSNRVPHVNFMAATAEYHLGRYERALTSVERAIADADEPAEDTYDLKLAIQLEQEDYVGAIDTLEFLHARWPSEERARRLENLRSDLTN